MIAMIDMGIGNLQSVVEAFRRVGADLTATTDPDGVEQADAVILPGVGAFGDGMASLREKGLVGPLRTHSLEKQKPLLGICLGMQLLAEGSDEHGKHEGLGFVRGRAVRLAPTTPEARVPNIGWCDVAFDEGSATLFTGLATNEPFYFAHSYHVECEEPADVAASFDYGGVRVTAAIERGSILGVQFHPEKSQDSGLNVLASYIEYLRQAALTAPAR